MAARAAFPGFVLVFLFIAILAAGVITGIALLAAGLAGKRRGMWITGLVMLLCSMGIVVALGIVGVLMFFVAGRSTTPARRAVAAAPPVAVSPPRAVPASQPRAVNRPVTVAEALALPSGVKAPRSARILSRGTSFRNGKTAKRRAMIQVGPDIQPVLTTYYEKVSWDRIATLMTMPHLIRGDRNWAPSHLAGLECYRRSKADAQDPARRTGLCYDRQAGRVYCAWMEDPQAIPNDTNPPAGQ